MSTHVVEIPGDSAVFGATTGGFARFEYSAAVVVSYHPDTQANLAGFPETKKRFIGEPFPTWPMIGVSGLTRPEFLLEVRAVAAYPVTGPR